MRHDHSAPAEKASPCVVVPSPDLRMSRRVAIIDVAVVGGTSLVYVALEALDLPKRWSFVAVGVALAVYAMFLLQRRTHSLHAVGFRTDNLMAGLVPVGICTV